MSGRPPQASYLVKMGLDFEAFARLFDEPVNISSAIQRLEETISLESLLLSSDLLLYAEVSKAEPSMEATLVDLAPTVRCLEAVPDAMLELHCLCSSGRAF